MNSALKYEKSGIFGSHIVSLKLGLLGELKLGTIELQLMAEWAPKIIFIALLLHYFSNF